MSEWIIHLMVFMCFGDKVGGGCGRVFSHFIRVEITGVWFSQPRWTACLSLLLARSREAQPSSSVSHPGYATPSHKKKKFCFSCWAFVCLSSCLFFVCLFCFVLLRELFRRPTDVTGNNGVFGRTSLEPYWVFFTNFVWTFLGLTDVTGSWCETSPCLHVFHIHFNPFATYRLHVYAECMAEWIRTLDGKGLTVTQSMWRARFTSRFWWELRPTIPKVEDVPVCNY